MTEKVRCQHCYTGLQQATTFDGKIEWIDDQASPGRYPLSAMNCIPGLLTLNHKPMPRIEATR